MRGHCSFSILRLNSANHTLMLAASFAKISYKSLSAFPACKVTAFVWHLTNYVIGKIKAKSKSLISIGR